MCRPDNGYGPRCCYLPHGRSLHPHKTIPPVSCRSASTVRRSLYAVSQRYFSCSSVLWCYYNREYAFVKEFSFKFCRVSLDSRAKNPYNSLCCESGSSAVGSALGSGPRGREFKSHLSDHVVADLYIVRDDVFFFLPAGVPHSFRRSFAPSGKPKQKKPCRRQSRKTQYAYRYHQRLLMLHAFGAARVRITILFGGNYGKSQGRSAAVQQL